MTPQNQPFISSGFANLDRLLAGGLRKGTLTALAARPGQGESNFFQQIAANAVLNGGEGCLIVSAARSRVAVMENLIALRAGCGPSLLNTSFCSGTQWGAIVQAASDFSGTSLYIADVSKPSTSFIREMAKLFLGTFRTRAQGQLGLVIVDRLDLIREATRNASGRHKQIESKLKDLKRLAAELNTAILVVARLGLRYEQFLRESPPKFGDIERAGLASGCDEVILLHREGAYRQGSGSAGTRAQLFVARRLSQEFSECRLRYDLTTETFKEDA